MVMHPLTQSWNAGSLVFPKWISLQVECFLACRGNLCNWRPEAAEIPCAVLLFIETYLRFLVTWPDHGFRALCHARTNRQERGRDDLDDIKAGWRLNSFYVWDENARVWICQIDKNGFWVYFGCPFSRLAGQWSQYKNTHLMRGWCRASCMTMQCLCWKLISAEQF